MNFNNHCAHESSFELIHLLNKQVPRGIEALSG